MTPSRRFFTGTLLIPLLCSCLPAGEKVLYEGDSEFNHIVVVEDEMGLRSLMFEKDGALQSVVKLDDVDHLELPYVRAMLVGLAFVEKPKRVLMVGLGGGTIPRFLHKHFPDMTIDVVDIDPKVVFVAKKFFGVKEDKRLKIHTMDGRKFIENVKERYDLILLDAYGRDNIPYLLATREFLLATRRALTPKGVIAGNVWSRYSNELYRPMVRTYRDVFEDLIIFDVHRSGNKILVPLSHKEKVQKRTILEKARQISKERSFPYDLGEVVSYGFRYTSNRGFGKRILRDADVISKSKKQ